MTPTAHCAAHRPEYPENHAQDDQDDADRPKDGDVEQRRDNKTYDAGEYQGATSKCFAWVDPSDHRYPSRAAMTITPRPAITPERCAAPSSCSGGYGPRMAADSAWPRQSLRVTKLTGVAPCGKAVAVYVNPAWLHAPMDHTSKKGPMLKPPLRLAAGGHFSVAGRLSKSGQLLQIDGRAKDYSASGHISVSKSGAATLNCSNYSMESQRTPHHMRKQI